MFLNGTYKFLVTCKVLSLSEGKQLWRGAVKCYERRFTFYCKELSVCMVVEAGVAKGVTTAGRLGGVLEGA